MPLTTGIVGKIADTISAIDPSHAQIITSTNIGQGYDFAIAGMAFRVHSTDNFPYQRETAPYRKDQFDVGQTVGEQSLTGWWLRSQFSWHHGAGIKYYEVLDGDTVINRYKTAVGVDPWEPGEVSVVSAFAAGVGSNVVDAVPGALLGTNGVFTLGSGGTINHRTASGSTVITSGGTVTSITTSGTTLYATVDNTIKVQDAATTLATLWTHTDVGVTWQRVWWAKGRLFAVDSDDKWYALPKGGGDGTVAAADPEMFYDPGVTAGEWVLTETPAFVLVGNGTDIMAITLSTDGSVPSLAAPTVVAQVPAGETIASLHFYLGYVFICTQAGLRVGQADTSDGTPAMAFGPLLIDGDFSASKRLASRGSLVWAIGDHEDYQAATMFAVNLAEFVSDLLPAWTAWFELGDAVSANQGCVADPDGMLWGWSNGTIRVQDSTLDASGTLVTGQLRMGTLEPKLFRSVRVRVTGDGGTVGVSYVLPDGTTEFLYSLDVAQQKELDVQLNLSEPQESIGLQFSLTSDISDPAVRPALLGYQIRALPSPQRQRMLRVPLLMQDVEKNRRGGDRGRKGSAWERLQALEDIEAGQLLTQFIDYRTGEAGLASIESIRFQSDTPSKQASSGFGGVVYVELRKIG